MLKLTDYKSMTDLELYRHWIGRTQITDLKIREAMYERGWIDLRGNRLENFPKEIERKVEEGLL